MPKTKNNPDNFSEITTEEMMKQANDVFTQNSVLTATVNLPSNGKIKGIPKQVVIKAIQRKDKKKALLSDDDDILLSLLQACIISPENFNIYNLLPFEVEYLLYRLRILTYGSEHTFKDRCPHCGHTNEVNVDLNALEIVGADSNFEMIFEIPPLPVSGMRITCKLLTEGELKSINKTSQSLKNSIGNNSATIDLIWEKRIVGINGKTDLVPIEITQILDDLNDYDSEYMMEYYSAYSSKYGLQTKLHYICDECNESITSDMPNIYTFFRPKFKIN